MSKTATIGCRRWWVAPALAAALLATPPEGAARVVIHDLGSVPGECFMFGPLDGSALYLANAVECRIQRSPASTFKIPHALIVLETRSVATSVAPAKWDGSKQPFPSWQADHSLESAIQSSVLWFFRRTAAGIGRDAMEDWLRRLAYGDDTFDRDVTSFWVNGDLVVSPREQLDFLARMFRYELPVSRTSVDRVMRALTMPAGRITNAAGAHRFDTGWPPGTIVRAKTGNTRVDDENVSWLVGGIESKGRQFVFAARLRSAQRLASTAGASVAGRYLRRLARQIRYSAP
jgi:beta-lactamase class D